MNQYKWPTFGLIIFLSGCMATPNEARSDSPLFTGTSTKAPESLAECIYEQWTNQRVMLERDNTTHTERVRNMITVFTMKDSMFADITAREGGSEVKFYKTFGMGYTVSGNRQDIVKNCL
ncbi:hypothetical protein PMPD1_3145 [Paramixta manurensis]|uniref:Lipoprotein n=1 Tax=Paramixta manurensis TaxID=2740817 RepID=A0A6M8UBP1_9GAMM|nr:hypothetical protein PMPD1_3145 [Erwiniaceae bacterium PD-1]